MNVIPIFIVIEWGYSNTYAKRLYRLMRRKTVNIGEKAGHRCSFVKGSFAALVARLGLELHGSNIADHAAIVVTVDRACHAVNIDCRTPTIFPGIYYRTARQWHELTN
jgi:hypothetical protein